MAIAEVTERGGRFYLVSDNTKDIVFGMQQAVSFARKVAAGERVDRQRYNFDDKFLREIHKRVAHGTGHAGELRKISGLEIDSIPVCPPSELPAKFFLYGRWLDRETKKLKEQEEDPIKALEVAAAAHHGIVQPPHHPFYNGNGRSARVVAGAVMMSTTYELRVHHKAIPPLPLLRELNTTESDKYIEATRAVTETSDLHPFMTFLAKKWIDTLEARHLDVYTAAPRPLNRADENLIESLQERLHTLKHFVIEGSHDNTRQGRNRLAKYPVPDYFSIDNLRPH